MKQEEVVGRLICDNCKFNNRGCTVKGIVIASGGESCKFHSAMQLEKNAQNILYTISWLQKDEQKPIIYSHINGKIQQSA